MLKELSRPSTLITLMLFLTFGACVAETPTDGVVDHVLDEPTQSTVTTIPTIQAENAFQVGWWVDRDVGTPQTLATYATEGNTFILLTGSFCNTSQLATTEAYLKEADKHNMKAIVGLTCDLEPNLTQIPNLTTDDFIYIINTLKNNPALYGYYLADEPDIKSWERRHYYLDVDPGYYHLVKEADPNHPVFVTFDRAANDAEALRFFDVLDIVGVHSYPFWSVDGEFGNVEGREIYDTWKSGLEVAQANGKQGFIATVQGFGDNTDFPYRNPTYNELKYQTFSAVVLGVNKVLFWMDTWGEKGNMMGLVNQMVEQIQSIGTEMNNGVTNDPRIIVSQPVSELAYRSGVDVNSQVILAVNIADRFSREGATLSNVKFTLPSGENISSVDVLYESRTIPVINHTFTDDFHPFEVHIYQYYLQ